MIKVLIAAIFLVSVSTVLVHPSPSHVIQQADINLTPSQSLNIGSPCLLHHSSTGHERIDSGYYFRKIQSRNNNMKECALIEKINELEHTKLEVRHDAKLAKEAYRLKISEKGIQIEYAEYSGYVYAMQTLSQLLKHPFVPYVEIQDEPRLQHRGIMIDTAKHFINLSTIKRLISIMPISKLNILHWHLADDEAFSFNLQLHPELSQYGAYSAKQIYQIDDIKELIALAEFNGVSIVPEVNTIGGMRSWAQSPIWKNKNITIHCNKTSTTPSYCHQLDPSKAAGLELVQQVVTELDNIFKKSPYIHLGGSKINFDCWDSRTNIKNTFMKLHNIKNYDGLVEYIRYEIKQAIPSSRKVVYWIDKAQNYSAGDNDILQFTGNSSQTLQQVLNQTKSPIILSPFDLFDLSAGLGDMWAVDPNNRFNTYWSIYKDYDEVMSKVDISRLIGGEVLAWGTATNNDNFENILWMRSAVFGQRMWSTRNMTQSDLIKSMVQIQQTLSDMGIDISPLTSEYCEYNPEKCFPPEKQEMELSEM